MATPPAATTVVVPDRMPPAGFAPNAIVTFPLKPVAGFPNASRAMTWTGGLIAVAAGVVEGSTVNLRPAAGAAITLNAPLVVPARLAPATVAESL